MFSSFFGIPKLLLEGDDTWFFAYTWKRSTAFDVEARQLANELGTILGIKALKNVRLVNRYDVEGISEELFAQATPTVFSEPQVDNVSADLPDFGTDTVFAVDIYLDSSTSVPIPPANASS